MFGLFRKKAKETDSISTCIALANDAAIDAVMENGNYTGFLIFLNEDVSTLAGYFKNQDAMSAFIGAIEDKLSDGQFNDPGAGIDMVDEVRELTGWKPNMNAVRAILDRGNRPVFKWEP